MNIKKIIVCQIAIVIGGLLLSLGMLVFGVWVVVKVLQHMGVI